MLNTNENGFIVDYDDNQNREPNEYVTGVKSCSTIDTNIMAIVTAWKSGDLLIPKFQRRFVWTLEQASCFIESLMLELPVPSIIIHKDSKGYQHIIDGQQRIKSILYFMGELGEKSVHKNDIKFVNFRLTGLSSENPYFKKTYKGDGITSFTEEQRRFLRNRNIPITTITLDDSDKSIKCIYSIFKRLNTKGTPLTEQEIRYCIYSGVFNDFLYKLNEDEIWQSFFTNEKDHTRQKDAELILRFFALQEHILLYKKPMKKFLSDYCKSKEKCSIEELDHKRKLFLQTINSIYNNLGERPFHAKNQINSSVVDSIMIAFSKNLNNIPSDIYLRYHDLLKDTEYNKCISQSSNDVKSVQRRVEIAEEILFKQVSNIDTKVIKLYDLPVSAGLGNWIDDNNIPFQEIVITNRRADFALKISGDSMEPKINDGDIVLVQKTSDIKTSNIGIFTYKNEVFCKKYIKSKSIYLWSINNKKYRKPIKIEDIDSFFINGLVVEILPKTSTEELL